jgi:type II secretory pathway component PulF
MQFIKKLLQGIQLAGFRAKRDDFYEQLSRSYDNKESLREFLNAEYDIARNKKTKDSSRATALKIIRNRLATGNQSKYSQLLQGVMPISDKMMLSALDDAPDKAALMRQIASNVREQRKLIALVKGKLIPPLLILPGAFAFSYVMATKSLPIIVKIAPPEVWTPFNMAVRRFAEFVAGYGLLSVAIVAVLVTFFFHQLPRWTGKIRNRLEQVGPGMAALLFPVAPFILPLGIYRDVQAGIMFSALSIMLQSGRTLNDALIEIRNSSQPWMRAHIRRILAHLDVHTTEYTQAFSKGLVSPQLLARLSSQIRTNPRFDQVLIDIGQRGGDEIRVEVEKQTSKVNLMLLCAGGFTVIFMMVGQMNISGSMTEEMSPQKQMAKRMKAQMQSAP